MAFLSLLVALVIGATLGLRSGAAIVARESFLANATSLKGATALTDFAHVGVHAPPIAGDVACEGPSVPAENSALLFFFAVEEGKELPDYAKRSLSWTRARNPHTPIYFMSNSDAAFEITVKGSDGNRTISSADLKLNMFDFHDFSTGADDARSSKKGRPTGTWFWDLQKFTYIETFMRKQSLSNVFVVELDNVVHVDPDKILPELIRNAVPLAATPLTTTYMTPGVVYIRSPDDIHKLNAEADSWLQLESQRSYDMVNLGKEESGVLKLTEEEKANSRLEEVNSDMQFFGWFRHSSKDGMYNLPVLPLELQSQVLPMGKLNIAPVSTQLSSEGVTTEVLFDPGSYGQWLGGLRTLRHHIVQAAILDDKIQFDPVTFEVKNPTEHTAYRLFNIHWYHKNLIQKHDETKDIHDQSSDFNEQKNASSFLERSRLAAFHTFIARSNAELAEYIERMIPSRTAPTTREDLLSLNSEASW